MFTIIYVYSILQVIQLYKLTNSTVRLIIHLYSYMLISVSVRTPLYL